MKTGLLELHLRRVVWRHGDRGADWKVYGFLVVAFGDRQAAVLLQIVIRMTCEMYKNVDLIAAQKIQDDLFVDDLVTGGELELVDRFMGDKDVETIHMVDTAVLTKRICLSIVNSIYDPLGLLTPITINLKVMMKQIFSAEYGLTIEAP